MTNSSPKAAKRRTPLTPARVVDGAVALADRTGMEKFTIRRLADELDVKPMTIYHHLPNKEAIIDEMVDRVFAEIELPPSDADWRTAITIRSHSARAALGRHPWATPLMESRTNAGPATLRHHDAVLGCFLAAGFSLSLTAHAYAVIDAFIYGFALQEESLPATEGQDLAELASTIVARFEAGQYPHLAAFTTEHVMAPGYSFTSEFDYGLDLILDGLQTAAADE